jgi:hypothetical protein
MRLARGVALLVTPALVALQLAAGLAAESASRAFPVGEAPFAGQLAGIDREWNLSFKTASKVRVIRATELAYWGQWRDVELGPQIILSDGGIVRADVLLIDESQVFIGDATGLSRGFWDESKLPRQAVHAIVFQPPVATSERDRMELKLQQVNGPQDEVVLLSGETVSGRLVSAPQLGRFTATEMEARSELFEIASRGRSESIRIPAAKVIAVRFGARTTDPAKGEQATSSTQHASAPAAWMGLSDGSLIQTSGIAVRRDAVTVSLVAGGELKTTLEGRGDSEKRFWDAITYLEPINSRVTWLSDRQPLSFQYVPFLSVQRPLSIDRSVLGARLRAGQSVFRKGLGMASASRAEFDVARHRRFEAEIAIDDAAGLSGSVICKVALPSAAGGWSTAYASPVIRGGDARVLVSIDLNGAQKIALVIEYAERGDECDYADWLCARLIK